MKVKIRDLRKDHSYTDPESEKRIREVIRESEPFIRALTDDEE